LQDGISGLRGVVGTVAVQLGYRNLGRSGRRKERVPNAWGDTIGPKNGGKEEKRLENFM